MSLKRENPRTKLFNRRTALLLGGQVGLFSILAARMYYLQVIESEKYKVLADENRISLRLLAPPRGRVLARDGEVLAVNQLNYRVVVTPEQTGSVPATLDVISNILNLTEGERRRILREVARKRRFLPITIRDNLSWEEVARIAVNAQDLPGVSIDSGSSRYYPYGPELAHLVGYVAPPSEADLTGDPLLELPDFRIGRNGIERVYDLAMRGKAGTTQVEVNAAGRPIRELARVEGEPGLDIVLTVDLALQRKLHERLSQEESGAAVLLDVQTGEILALASTPSYDPNEFSKGIPAGLWRKLISDHRHPLNNKAVSGTFAPGSTFKMITAIAALEAGVIAPEQRVSCRGHVELGDAKFHCWKRGGHGPVDLIDGIKYSCDVYFYELARRTGIDKIAEVAKRFGLGQTVGIDLPNEKAGLIPTRAWKRATLGSGWAQGESLVNGIGQGYITATPLQLAVMTARLVNGGYAIQPRLTRDAITGRAAADRPTQSWPHVGVSPQIINLVLRGMRAVVNDPRGTAFKARIIDKQNPHFAMGGKTGTAQVRRITEEERRVGLRKPEQVPWRERDHALFVGYAPVDDPRFAVAVVIEHGGGGSSVAAPIARDILHETLQRYNDRLDLPGERFAAERPA
jgi:penicillin-binding protein 2